MREKWLLPGWRRVLSCLLPVFLSGCASTSVNDMRDPYEGFNRSVTGFNDYMDEHVFVPVGKTYKTVAPNPVDRGISNFFSNLGDVTVVTNDLLQFKVEQAIHDLVRLFLNTTMGVLGFFDVATPMGLPKHYEDFGQTLAVWGVGPGPYLVVPLIGPATFRDAAGFTLDRSVFYPVPYLTGWQTRTALFSLETVDIKADLQGTQDLMREAALDPYEFVKNAYLERRLNLIRDRSMSSNVEDEFEGFEEFEEFEEMESF